MGAGLRRAALVGEGVEPPLLKAVESLVAGLAADVEPGAELGHGVEPLLVGEDEAGTFGHGAGLYPGHSAPGLVRGYAGERICYPCARWTLYSEGAPKRIAKAVPDAKFVVVLRHPTDRAYSNWTFNLGLGYETIATFEAALEAEPERVAREGGPWHHHYVRAGFYADQLERYFDVFGRDRVLVLFFDDLKIDTYEVMHRIYEFIGVDSSFRPEIEIFNWSYLPRSRMLHNLSWRENLLKSVLKKILPSGVSADLGRRIKQINKTDPPKIGLETQRALDETFRPHIERLSTLLAEDLTARWLDRSDLPGQKVLTTQSSESGSVLRNT